MKWGRRFLIAVPVVSLVIVAADAAINDEWDELTTNRFRTRLPPSEHSRRPHVVILGSGWGALSVLRRLHTDEYRVTVISPRNYFLFTPLLASTTVGTLHQRSIVEPVRAFCNRSDAKEATYVEAECTAFDLTGNSIHCVGNNGAAEFDVPYDALVVAVGAEPATFGIPGVAENTIFLKEIGHSYRIRDRILNCLETANIPGMALSEIERLLHFVVVGGGPAGVEFAAELHDFVVADVARNYSEHEGRVRISLVEALPHVLTMFDAALTAETEKTFQRTHIDLLLNKMVKEITPKSIVMTAKDTGVVADVGYGLCVWAGGNATRAITRAAMAALGPLQTDRRGILVDSHHRALGSSNVFAIGDCSISKSPPTAQVASQQGIYLGRLLNALSPYYMAAKESKITSDDLKGRVDAAPPFAYRNLGAMCYIGDHSAVAQIPSADRATVTLSHGRATYYLWRSVYLSKLLSSKNRFAVLSDWTKTSVFGRDVSRA